MNKKAAEIIFPLTEKKLKRKRFVIGAAINGHLVCLSCSSPASDIGAAVS
jgi:hypothetical protein